MDQHSSDLRLGSMLRKLRREAGCTQAAAARMAGIGVSALRLLEKGGGTLKSWRAALLALKLEIRGRSLPAGPLGPALTMLRKRRQLSARRLASMIGVTRATLAAIERDGAGRLQTLAAYGEAVAAGLYLAPRDAARSFFTHAGNSSAYHGFRTPPEIMAPLYRALGDIFDLDPCAASAARHASVKARIRLTAADDGLSLPWRGKVFCNPPYGRSLGLWMEKCRREARAGAIVIALVPARPDAGWWHDCLVGHAAILMLRGRLRFQGADGNSAPFPRLLRFGEPRRTLLVASQRNFLVPGSFLCAPMIKDCPPSETIALPRAAVAIPSYHVPAHRRDVACPVRRLARTAVVRGCAWDASIRLGFFLD